MKELVIAMIGLAGAAIAHALGGWDMALQTLIIFMTADYALGMVLAGIFKKSKHGGGAISSKPSGSPKANWRSHFCFAKAHGWRGLVKKGMQLLLVLVGYRLDIMLDVDFVRLAVIIAFISSELISLLENAAIMGIPVPPALQKALEVLNHGEAKKRT